MTDGKLSEAQRCDTCLHWQQDQDQLFGTKRCAKAVQMWDASEWDAYTGFDRVLLPKFADQMMFVKDGSDYRADLYTRADFYCTHHAAGRRALSREVE